ncbi:DUF2782 domain-containing protein [Chitinimonas lacunae]|uniref:DUF2782 domain-containing protein n=1 Tax=Chitinimonas lacunae TaxID=1963018 RepID=A0ABV8MR79_9NEIS
MRTLSYCLLLWLAGAALAADIPPPPPLPPATATPSEAPAAEPEPEVRVIEKADATHTEYRVNGQLYMVKVRPKVGPEYFLIDENGSGSMVRREIMPKNSVPRWVIKRF